MAYEDDLRDIRARIARAQARQARAEVEQEQAIERRDAALKALRDDYGVRTSADAAELTKRLEAELADALADARQQLDAVNA